MNPSDEVRCGTGWPAPMKNPGAFRPPEDRNEELRAEFEELADHLERVAASSAAALQEFRDAILAFAKREGCGRLEVAELLTFDKPAPSRLHTDEAPDA